MDENEAYRRRVLDVRNWFEFWADEKFRGTQELKKTHRQMGQLSGGEKAQLKRMKDKKEMLLTIGIVVKKQTGSSFLSNFKR